MVERPIADSPRPFVLVELDRLRSENETLRQMHAAQSAKVDVAVGVLAAAEEAADCWKAERGLRGGPWTSERLRDWHAASDLLGAAMADLCVAVTARRAGKEVQ